MNRKIMIVSILAVLLLVAISFASAVNTNTTNTDNKESPLYRIRTRKAIRGRVDELKETIKTKFFGERIIFLPFLPWENNINVREKLMGKFFSYCMCLWPLSIG